MTEISADFNNLLPPNTVLAKDALVTNGENVPVTAEIGGKKVQVGTGTLDTRTGRFTAVLSDDHWGEIFRGRLENDVHVIRSAKLHSVSLVAEEPDPSKGVYPVTIVEPSKVTEALNTYHNKEKQDG